MAYKCSFLDNQSYTAQDVNDIFSRISHGGVVFTDTGYAFGDLNDAQATAVTEGVTRDENSCKVVVTDGVYKISKGACFMFDGSAIVFDANGQEIEVPEGVYSYVYLWRNTVGNSIDIVVSECSGDEASVPLAEIDELGRVFDRRRYAKAKIDVASWGSIKNFTVNFTKCTSTKSETVTVDMGNGDFSYIIMWDGERIYRDNIQNRVAYDKNLMELIEGEDILLSIGRLGQHDEYMHVMKDGQNLHIYLNKPFPSAEYTLNLGVI